MKAYDTLSEAIEGSKKQGYTIDFTPIEGGLCDRETKKEYSENDLHVVEVFRFEGMSNPGDMSVLYLIETDDGVKGQLSDAFGTYADNVSRETMTKLHMNWRERMKAEGYE